jgi:hypothetical protein
MHSRMLAQRGSGRRDRNYPSPRFRDGLAESARSHFADIDGPQGPIVASKPAVPRRQSPGVCREGSKGIPLPFEKRDRLLSIGFDPPDSRTALRRVH